MKTSYATYQESYHNISSMKSPLFKYNSEKEEPYISINSNTREIVIPNTMQNIGVIGDHNAETVWFKIDRYFDRKDFRELLNNGGLEVIVQFVNAMNEPYVYKVSKDSIYSKDMLEDKNSAGAILEKSEDTIIFPWELSNEVTKYSGTVKFSIRIFEVEVSKDSEGKEVRKVLYAYNTQQAQFNILNGLNNADAPGTVNTLTPTQVEEIFDKISKIYVESLGIATDTNGDKVQSIITYDYSVLGNKPTIITPGGEKIELKGEIEAGVLISGYEGDQLITIKSLDKEVDIKSENAVSNKAVAEKFATVEPIAVVDANSENPIQSKVVSSEIKRLDKRITDFKVDVDSSLSSTSENPVQNKVIFEEIEALRAEMGGLSYIPIEVIKFNSDPQYYEKGYTMNKSLQFNWELSKAPNSLSIEGLDMGATAISPTQKGQLMTTSYQPMSEDTTFTLVATDNKNTVRKDFTVKFVLGIYYGSMYLDSMSEITAEDIKGLTKVLRENKNFSFDVEPGENEYIIFASPVDYGECTFKVGGFDGGFKKVDIISIENNYSTSAEYYIYKSSNANLGTTTVQVI